MDRAERAMNPSALWIWVICVAAGTILGAGAGLIIGLAVWIGGNTDGIRSPAGPVSDGITAFALLAAAGVVGGVAVAGCVHWLSRRVALQHSP